jgi:hypothetical protein
MVDVSSGEPFATLPMQVSRPDSRSTHLNFASFTLSSGKVAPSSGAVMVTDGFTASTLNASSFGSSTRPRLSVARYWTTWLPVVKPETGPEYVVQAPPSSVYSIIAMPEPPLVADSVSVGEAYHPFLIDGVSVAVVTGFSSPTP